MNMRKFLAILLGGCLLFAGLHPAAAQAENTPRLSLFDLQTGSFPAITAGLDVFDPAGNVVPGLEQQAVTLLEDDQTRPLDSLEQIQAGVVFALALDPGPPFAYRDAYAVTRLDKIVQALQNWASAHPDAAGDDLSLVPTFGSLSSHLKTAASFLDALAAYQPDLKAISPSLNTLSRALDTVSEPAPQPGMKRTVLFVTSPPAVEDIPTLQNLAERAAAQQVRVNVWIVVTSADFFTSSGATALKDLAIQTGGQFALFTGQETLPDIEAYLTPLRPTYRMAYTSFVRTSGEHNLTVQVALDGGATASATRTFTLDIQPPNPILVSPPEQITRQAPDESTTAAVDFLPDRQAIDVIIEFPDGRPRPLASTALLVDDQKVAENTAAPFDHFTWDLSGYDTSGQHLLSVEAVDSLGLRKVSLGIPVKITVVKPKFGLLPFLSRNSLWVALAAILLAGAVVGIILAGGRIRRRARPVKGVPHLNPLTQPVEKKKDRQKNRRKMRLNWKPARQPDACLVRLKDDGQPVEAPSIPVVVPEMTFGSDPLQVTHILDDPSVSPLHARIRLKNGEYLLSDEKSTAGTWVNYESLTDLRRLQHGDVLHIGRLSYRFMLRRPPERPAPKITYIKR
jgi:hypothetical protein